MKISFSAAKRWGDVGSGNPAPLLVRRLLLRGFGGMVKSREARRRGKRSGCGTDRAVVALAAATRSTR